MKAKMVYYSVFGLKDGTVFAVLPVTKPRKTKHGPAPKIDADGVCRFNVEEVVPSEMTDCNRTVFHTAVATALNVKRLLRELVAGRLDAMEKAVAETHEQLARIEDKLDQLIRANGPGPSWEA
jgi:hypothetical protein